MRLGVYKHGKCSCFLRGHKHREQALGRMFEARLAQGGVLKKLSDVLKDFVDCHRMSSFDCSANGFGLQALDATHVTLVSVLLRSEGFNHYRCDRPVFLGLNVDALAHILKCANDDDVVTLKARPSVPCPDSLQRV